MKVGIQIIMAMRSVMMVMTMMKTLHASYTHNENHSRFTERPYIFANSRCPTFLTESHKIDSIEKCEHAINALIGITAIGGANSALVVDGSHIRSNNFSEVYPDAMTADDTDALPCGCYLYDGDSWNSPELYALINAVRVKNDKIVLPRPVEWKVGDVSSFVIGFFSSGPAAEDLSLNNLTNYGVETCSSFERNNWFFQWNWKPVCVGMNPLDVCACQECLQARNENSFALNFLGNAMCNNIDDTSGSFLGLTWGTGPTRTCCENMSVNRTAVGCSLNASICQQEFNGSNVDRCDVTFGICTHSTPSIFKTKIPNTEYFQIVEDTSCSQYNNALRLTAFECADVALTDGTRSFIVNQEGEPGWNGPMDSFMFGTFEGCSIVGGRYVFTQFGTDMATCPSDAVCLCKVNASFVPDFELVEEKVLLQYTSQMFFYTQELNVTNVILDSVRQTIALKAAVYTDQVQNVTITKKSSTTRRHRTLSVMVPYKVEFIIVSPSYASSEASEILLKESFESNDDESLGKSDFSELFFATYVILV